MARYSTDSAAADQPLAETVAALSKEVRDLRASARMCVASELAI